MDSQRRRLLSRRRRPRVTIIVTSLQHRFPEIACLVRWHLCDDRAEPLHYIANGKYWLEKHLGIFKVFENSENEGRRPGEPEPFEAFKSTIVFGALDDDDQRLITVLATEAPDPTTLPELEDTHKERNARAVVNAATRWLRGRSERLKETMVADMDRCGVEFIPEDKIKPRSGALSPAQRKAYGI